MEKKEEEEYQSYDKEIKKRNTDNRCQLIVAATYLIARPPMSFICIDSMARIAVSWQP